MMEIVITEMSEPYVSNANSFDGYSYYKKAIRL